MKLAPMLGGAFVEIHDMKRAVEVALLRDEAVAVGTVDMAHAVEAGSKRQDGAGEACRLEKRPAESAGAQGQRHRRRRKDDRKIVVCVEHKRCHQGDRQAAERAAQRHREIESTQPLRRGPPSGQFTVTVQAERQQAGQEQRHQDRRLETKADKGHDPRHHEDGRRRRETPEQAVEG